MGPGTPVPQGPANAPLTYDPTGDNKALFTALAETKNGAYTVQESQQAVEDFARKNGRMPKAG